MPTNDRVTCVAGVDVCFNVKEMMQSGVHFGHHTSVRHPAMRPYILGKMNAVVIIDISKTIGLFLKALEIIGDVVKSGRPILFVGTKKFAKTIVKEIAEACDEHYVNHRWLGGLLTNSGTVNLALKRLNMLEDRVMREDIKLKKKERVMLSKHIDRMSKCFGGCRKLSVLPGVIVVLDVGVEKIAVLEARKMGVPVVGVVDTNTDPTGVAYPIPANDDSMKSISYILWKISHFISDVKKAHFDYIQEPIIGSDVLYEKHHIADLN